jgi:hypothetical protein
LQTPFFTTQCNYSSNFFITAFETVRNLEKEILLQPTESEAESEAVFEAELDASFRERRNDLFLILVMLQLQLMNYSLGFNLAPVNQLHLRPQGLILLSIF